MRRENLYRMSQTRLITLEYPSLRTPKTEQKHKIPEPTNFKVENYMKTWSKNQLSPVLHTRKELLYPMASTPSLDLNHSAQDAQ